MPNTKIAEFANTVDTDESANNEFSSGSTEFALFIKIQFIALFF